MSAPACHAPLVQAAGNKHLNPEGFPLGSEVVVLSNEGVSLKGIFAPAEPGVPRRGLAVHFLPAAASVTSGLRGGLAGIKETLHSYALLGWGSLIVDYQGVGASSGTRIPEQLAKDAETVWAEALRRIRPNELVVLRGVSLGSLPVAALLAKGVKVDGVILHAPVRSPSVMEHEARFRYGHVLGSLIGLFLQNPQVPDLLDHIDLSQRILVVIPEDDRFLSTSELASLRQRATAPQHEIVLVSQHDHADLVLRAFGFEISEYSVKHLSKLPEEEVRFLEVLSKRE
jgi:hypothetical protein